MRRPLRPDESRLWAHVLSTVRPLPGRSAPAEMAESQPAPAPPPATTHLPPPGRIKGPPPRPPRTFTPPPPPIVPAVEPNRNRRIVVGREEIGARLDLHGHGQDAARRVLTDFILRARAEGWRAVLVITGKGTSGEGVLRRRVPEWLAEPPLRPAVAGVAHAARSHGGEGALYVALKRRD